MKYIKTKSNTGIIAKQQVEDVEKFFSKTNFKARFSNCGSTDIITGAVGTLDKAKLLKQYKKQKGGVTMFYIIVTSRGVDDTIFNICKAGSVSEAKSMVGSNDEIGFYVSLAKEDLDALSRVDRGIISKLV